MSLASTLLRLVLMVGLLLNGVNSAAAGQPRATAAADAAPPCHTAAHAQAAPAAAAPHVQAPDEDHCHLEQCLRSCAQQPALVSLAALPLLSCHPPGRLPPVAASDRPTPALPPLQRPPIA